MTATSSHSLSHGNNAFLTLGSGGVGEPLSSLIAREVLNSSVACLSVRSNGLLMVCSYGQIFYVLNYSLIFEVTGFLNQDNFIY